MRPKVAILIKERTVGNRIWSLKRFPKSVNALFTVSGDLVHNTGTSLQKQRIAASADN
jgi:hypothetical protein